MTSVTDSSILHLSLIEGIGPVTIKQLVEKKPLSLSYDQIYQLSISDWRSLFNVSERIARKLVTGLQNKYMLDQELQLITKYKANWLSCEHTQYPALLKEINAPPPILYWYGAPPSSDKVIAIIGSRKANLYGQRVIKKLVTDFVAHNYTIISGGAIGADSMAHENTLALQGKTVAVLGSGLLHPYPAKNRSLFNAIVKTGGTVLSIFSMDTLPQTGHFPARNRVIAGLSRGCIVVQAAEKSGARITAQFALEQGRDVFAIPGDITDPLSIGCHALIKEGATIISSAQDVLFEWGESSLENKTAYVKTCNELEEQVTKKEVMLDDSLSDIQKKVLDFCAVPMAFDDLVVNMKISSEHLHTELFELQMSGKLKQDFTGMWQSI